MLEGPIKYWMEQRQYNATTIDGIETIIMDLMRNGVDPTKHIYSLQQLKSRERDINVELERINNER
jgi:hypothetical protein